MNIRMQGIEKTFGAHKVLTDVNLDIPHGKLTSFLGPSGCGKTTLLRIIAGLEKPDGGTISFDGGAVFSAGQGIDVPPEKRSLGFVFQDFSLWPHLSVFENVAFGLRARGYSGGLQSKVMDALHAVRLGEYVRRMPHQLSGGQQQRVSIARAIVTDPACILFDEPLSALDAVLRETLRDEIRDMIVSRGLTAVFVTHDQEEAMGISDEIVLLEEGRVIQKGTPEAIYSIPATPSAARFIGHANWLDALSFIRPELVTVQAVPGYMKVDMDVLSRRFCGDGYVLTTTDGQKTWQVKTPHVHETGVPIALYYPEDAVITYQGENLS